MLSSVASALASVAAAGLAVASPVSHFFFFFFCSFSEWFSEEADWFPMLPHWLSAVLAPPFWPHTHLSRVDGSDGALVRVSGALLAR